VPYPLALPRHQPSHRYQAVSLSLSLSFSHSTLSFHSLIRRLILIVFSQSIHPNEEVSAFCCSCVHKLFVASLRGCVRVSLSFSPRLWCGCVVQLVGASLRESLEEMMGYDALDRDARIKLSIGTKQQGDADGRFHLPMSLVFDHHQDLLFVVDSYNHRVQVLSCDDGSFVSKFGEQGDQPGQFYQLYGLAIDHDHDRILITDRANDRVQSWSLSDQSFLSCIGHQRSRDLEFEYPQGIAIDKHHHRIIIVDENNNRLVFLSSIDLSFLFSIGKHGPRPGEFYYPSSIAIDDDRHRIIVTDSNNHRVQVLSSIDGSFLFEFGSQGDQPCQFSHPQGVCIANQDRIIVADLLNNRLQSFTHEGHHISSFDCGTEKPLAVAFDEHRGLIAFTAGHRVHVIGANQWLADTFTWRPDRHRYAPSWMKQAVSTMTMIRSVVDECSAMSMIPNELLFEIFSHL